MMDKQQMQEFIARRVARELQDGTLVNLGIGLPTLVANFVPEGRDVTFQSENGFIGVGPAPTEDQVDPCIANAGAMPVTILPGGSFFDSAMSFGIIRGGHVDVTVLGALQVAENGDIANYMIPGKMVPGMGGAMDLTTGARVVIAATLHFEPSGTSRLKRRCTLPLTAAREVNYVVTDLGFFEVVGDRFFLRECFAPYTPEWIQEKTDATIVVTNDCKIVNLD